MAVEVVEKLKPSQIAGKNAKWYIEIVPWETVWQFLKRLNRVCHVT